MKLAWEVPAGSLTLPLLGRDQLSPYLTPGSGGEVSQMYFPCGGEGTAENILMGSALGQNLLSILPTSTQQGGRL